MSILLKSVFIGLPKKLGKKDAAHLLHREWESAIFKERTTDPIWLGKTKLSGDGQADLIHHGGLEKAVFAYSAAHYLYWQKHEDNPEIVPGGMGENFSIENQSENEVAIGDTYEIGDAIIQVSQPRQPCWKPARRFENKNLGLHIQTTGKTGWYYRVLREGFIQAGQTLSLIDRPYPKWTIEKCNEVIHGDPDVDALTELASCTLLAKSLRQTIDQRLESGVTIDSHGRLFGPNV